MAKVLLKGNEALAEAALAAGCRFYSGYPITPQTEILEYLSWSCRCKSTYNFIRSWIFFKTGRNFLFGSSRFAGSYC